MRFVPHISVDLRGNVTESALRFNAPFSVSVQSPPYAANGQFSVTRCGVELQTASVSCVTNAFAYDALGRKVARTDGRGNTTVYEYDLRGNKTYEGGATYPVRYTYDIFGNKTTMMTYRDESLGPESGDVTTWLYDESSGAMTNKVYADGKGPTYDYTPNGRLSRRTWARGITTDYAYDDIREKRNDNDLTSTLIHELTHALQACKWYGNDCSWSLKKEIEARICAKQCEGFDDCLQKALASSCIVPHCRNASDASKAFESVKEWFLKKLSMGTKPDGFCKFFPIEELEEE